MDTITQYSIGRVNGTVATFVSHATRNKLPSLDEPLKRIWATSFDMQSKVVTKEIRFQINEALQICDKAECKECKLHTAVQINVNAEEKKLFGRSRKYLYLALAPAMYDALELPMREQIQTWVKKLNTRLFTVVCEIFAHNADHLNLIIDDPEKGLRYIGDIYGKLTGKDKSLQTIATATFDAAKLSLQRDPKSNESHLPFKKANRQTFLRKEIFKIVTGETVQMWEAAQPQPKEISSEKSKGLVVTDVKKDDAWIIQLTDAVYTILCKKLPEQAKLAEIKQKLNLYITAQSTISKRDYQQQQLLIATAFTHVTDAVKQAQNLDVKKTDTAAIKKKFDAIKMASDYEQEFFAIVWKIVFKVWKKCAPQTTQKSAAPSSENSQKSQTSSKTDSRSSLLSPTSSKSTVESTSLETSIDSVYDYYETVLAGFQGIDGHDKRVTIEVSKSSLTGKWEQGAQREFRYIVTPSSVEAASEQNEEAIAFIIAFALAGHATDPAYEKFEEDRVSQSEELITLSKMVPSFKNHITNPLKKLMDEKITKEMILRNELRTPLAVTCGIQRSLAILLTFMFKHRHNLHKLSEGAVFDWTIGSTLTRVLKKESHFHLASEMERQKTLWKNMGLDIEEDCGIDISTAPKSTESEEEENQAEKICRQLNHIFFTILKKMSTQHGFTPKSAEKLIRIWFQAAREISLKEESLENFAAETLSKAHLLDHYGQLSTLICQAWTDAGIKMNMQAIPDSAKPALAVVVMPKSPVVRHKDLSEFERKKNQ